MVFSDTTTKLGLIQDCEMNIFGNYGDISGNADRLYDFTARINRSYDKIATKIMTADGRWQFDDTNYTDLPIGSTDVNSGQSDYAFDVEFLKILKVVLTDSSGNKSILNPIDISDSRGERYLTDNTTTGGIPTQYDKVGGSIILVPTPNFTRVGALTVHYQRKPSYFAYTDTTSKSPGIPATLHRYLSLDASLDYAIFQMLDQKLVNNLASKVKEMEDLVVEFYSLRSKDEQKFIRPVFRSSR